MLVIIICEVIVAYALINSKVTAMPLPNHNIDGTYGKWSFLEWEGWGIDTIVFSLINVTGVKVTPVG
jgi:hypothetical protein